MGMVLSCKPGEGRFAQWLLGAAFLLAFAVNAAAWSETLYNGIELPADWPPKVDRDDRRPIPVPYLEEANVPKVIPIDVGRQLFVDDFLVAATQGVVRTFYKPVKHIGNPVLWPQTRNELALNTVRGDGDYQPGDDEWDEKLKTAPACVMPGGGVWWDPKIRRFRMWYVAGWIGVLSYAESANGFDWTRPAIGLDGGNALDIVSRCDTFSVFPDYAAADPYANWRMSVSEGGNPTRSNECLSEDGIHWRIAKKSGFHGDSTTLFYNPFRRKWVWSLRALWRDRSRVYHEHDDFLEGADWAFPVVKGRDRDGGNPFVLGKNWTNTVDCFLWQACDDHDLRRTVDGRTYAPQLYNLDAVAYESIMLGSFKIICGMDNGESGRAGMPKSTSWHFGYSRDGFHFSRPDRTPAIDGSGWGSGLWDAGYVSPCSSGFVIRDERLWFFYSAVRGDRTRRQPDHCTLGNGMHAHFAIGVASLRRDGFAGLVADGDGEVLTRPLRFSGSHLFVNADARYGSLVVEVLDADGKVLPGFSASDCRPLARLDTTKAEITWKGGELTKLAGRPVRFRFKLHVTTLFSFWVSQDADGHSGGYLGGGGPDYPSLRDEGRHAELGCGAMKRKR